MIKAELSRRKFLGLTLVGAGCLMATPRLLAEAALPLRSGLQLYTLRDLMAKNVADTLQRVAQVGYEEVEFAGYFDQKPRTIRKLLDDNGLSAPAAHVMLDVLEKQFEASLEAAVEIGHKYLVIPYLDEQQRNGIEKYQKLAEQMNRWGEQSAKVGVKLAYHNHDFEFDAFGDQVPYHLLLAETDPRYVWMELDLYWTAKAGRDPLQYFNQHPGRFPLWHLKDMSEKGEFADLGDGVIDFAAILQAAHKAGLEHAFVERDHSPDAMATIKKGYQALQDLGIAAPVAPPPKAVKET